MKRTLSIAILSLLTATVAACAGDNQDDTDLAAVGTAEQDGRSVGAAEQDGRSAGTAEQQGAVGTAEQDGAVGTAEQASTSCPYPSDQLFIWYYTYSDASGTYHWDVTYDTNKAKWFVDEKKFGSTWRRQCTLTPEWPELLCIYPTPTQSFTLRCLDGTVSGTRTADRDCSHETVVLPDKTRHLLFSRFDDPCVQ